MDDISARLERLARLHSDGVLRDDEFVAAKAAVLSRPPRAVAPESIAVESNADLGRAESELDPSAAGVAAPIEADPGPPHHSPATDEPETAAPNERDVIDAASRSVASGVSGHDSAERGKRRWLQVIKQRSNRACALLLVTSAVVLDVVSQFLIFPRLFYWAAYCLAAVWSVAALRSVDRTAVRTMYVAAAASFVVTEAVYAIAAYWQGDGYRPRLSFFVVLAYLGSVSVGFLVNAYVFPTRRSSLSELIRGSDESTIPMRQVLAVAAALLALVPVARALTGGFAFGTVNFGGTAAAGGASVESAGLPELDDIQMFDCQTATDGPSSVQLLRGGFAATATHVVFVAETADEAAFSSDYASLEAGDWSIFIEMSLWEAADGSYEKLYFFQAPVMLSAGGLVGSADRTGGFIDPSAVQQGREGNRTWMSIERSALSELGGRNDIGVVIGGTAQVYVDNNVVGSEDFFVGNRDFPTQWCPSADDVKTFAL